MVWKKDLAKLKEELKKEGPSPARPPQPKPAPRKLATPQDLGGEDAMFLAAMGLRSPQPRLQDMLPSTEPPAPARAPQVPVPEEDFLEVMTSLKGLKRTPEAIPAAHSAPKSAPAPAPSPALAPPPSPPAPEAPPERPQAIETPSAKVPDREASRREPLLIQLAAGMAIEVDGHLDLRGHTRLDAIERLKERVLDGIALGWRSIHVVFGPSEELASAFQDFLKSPEASAIGRWAQAPIPMGGSQARILYYSGPGAPAKENP